MKILSTLFLIVAVMMILTLLYMGTVYATIALDQPTRPAMLLSFWLVACSLGGSWGLVRLIRS